MTSEELKQLKLEDRLERVDRNRKASTVDAD